MFQSIVDLITLSMFLGVSPGVRENLNAINRGEKKDLSAYKSYLKQVQRWFELLQTEQNSLSFFSFCSCR